MTARRGSRRHSERAVVALLTICVTLVAVASWFGGSLATDAEALLGPPLPWLVIAFAFVASNTFVINMQARREARLVYLSEIPMVVGLLYLDAPQLVAARLVGAAVSLGLLRRQYRTPRKLVFNLALAGAEATLALAVAHALVPAVGAEPPGVWIAAVVGTALSTGFDALAVGFVIALLEGPPEPRAMAGLLLRATADAVPVATLGIVVAAAWAGSRWAALPLLFGVGVLLWAYRAYAGLRERHRTLEGLYAFSHRVSTAAGGDEVVRVVLDGARELLHAENARLVLTPRPAETAEAERSAAQDAARAEDGGGEPAVEELTLYGERLIRRRTGAYTGTGSWLATALFTEVRPVLLARESRVQRERDHLRDLGARDSIAVPVLGDDGAIGVLAVDDRRGDVRGFDGDDLRLLELVGSHAATALRNGELVDRLRHDSFHDPLTGLPNRQMLQRRLSEERDQHRPFAVAILDLDGFKDVNDTLGHQQGDLLLQQVAGRLSTAVRDDATLVARLGGDEFAILRPDCSAEAAEELGETLTESLRKPFLVDGLELTVGCSIGLALAPEHGTTPAVLLKRADLSMYEAKQLGCGVRIFDPATDTTSRSRLVLVTQIRKAVEADEIEVHLQPKIVLDDARLYGVEALARWRHPSRGWISPEEFIPLAERSGLIRPITENVLRRAVSDCANWQRELPGVGIAVNVSLRALDDGLIELVDQLLEVHRLPPALLTLEITESSIMTDPPRTRAVLQLLRDRGVRLSVDDFGTGYTSLSYLRDLPVHEVKIDKSFLARREDGHFDATIVRSIIDLGRNLRLSVVAEGIADRSTWQQLIELDCDMGQGFAIARPAPPEDSRAWMIGYRDRTILPAIDEGLPAFPRASSG